MKIEILLEWDVNGQPHRLIYDKYSQASNYFYRVQYKSAVTWQSYGIERGMILLGEYFREKALYMSLKQKYEG